MNISTVFLANFNCGKAFGVVLGCNAFAVLLVFVDRRDMSQKVAVLINGRAIVTKLNQAELVSLLRYEYSFMFACICFLNHC